MNKVIVLGNLCKDIELRYTNSQKKVIQNTIGIRNDYKNANGDYDSNFVNVVFWEHNAEYLNKYATKGSRILVEGRITSRKYEKDKETRYVTEIQCENVQILDSRKNEEKEANTTEQNRTPEPSDPFAEFGETVEISDDDLPF